MKQIIPEQDISPLSLSISKSQPLLTLKKLFKGWQRTLTHSKNTKQLVIQLLDIQTSYLSKFQATLNTNIKQLCNLEILSKSQAESVYENWEIYMQVNQSILQFLNEIMIQGYLDDSGAVEKLFRYLLEEGEFFKVYRTAYQKINSVLLNINIFQTLNQEDPSKKKGKKLFFNSIFIPLRQIGSFKLSFQKYCHYLLAMKHPQQALIKSCLNSIIVKIRSTLRQINKEGWQNKQLKNLLTLFPAQLDSKDNSSFPIISKFECYINFQKCKVYIVDNLILLVSMKEKKVFQQVPIPHIQLNFKSYTKIYEQSQGLYLKNTVMVCGSNTCYNFSFEDRILMHFFQELVWFRINISPKITNQNYQVNPYYEEVSEVDVQVTAHAIFYRCNQPWYQINLKLPISRYLPDLSINQPPITQHLYLKLSKLLELKSYLLKIKSKSSDLHLIKGFLSQYKIMGKEQAKEFQCLKLEEFLLHLLRMQKFSENRARTLMKLGVSEGFYQAIKILENQRNYMRFCKCFDCKYLSEKPVNYMQLCFSLMKYQPKVPQNGFIHFITESKQTRIYCPIYLKKVADNYALFLIDKYTQNKKETLSILNRESLCKLREKIEMAIYNSRTQMYRIYYSLTQKNGLQSVSINIYDMQNKITQIKIIGLCQDSTIWHLKHLIGKKLGVSDLFLQSFVVSAHKSKTTKKQPKITSYQEMFILKNQEYLHEILDYLSKQKDLCLFLRKWIKIPYEEYKTNKIKELESFNYREIQLEVAEMMHQLETCWLQKFIQGELKQFYCKFIKACYLIYISKKYALKDYPQQFKYSDLHQIPYLPQKILQEYLLETRPSSNSITQIDITKPQSYQADQLQHLINTRLQQIHNEIENLSEINESQQYFYKINFMKELMFILDENSDWNLEVFEVLMCFERELDGREKDLEDFSLFYNAKLQINYYGILLKYQKQQDESITKIAYRELTPIVFGSLIKFYSSQSKNIILYSSQPHHIFQLISFYKKFQTDFETYNSSMSYLKEHLSVEFSVLEEKKKGQGYMEESSIMYDLEFEEKYGQVHKGKIGFNDQ